MGYVLIESFKSLSLSISTRSRPHLSVVVVGKFKSLWLWFVVVFVWVLSSIWFIGERSNHKKLLIVSCLCRGARSAIQYAFILLVELCLAQI